MCETGLAIRNGLLDVEEKLIWVEYADRQTDTHTYKVIQKKIFTNEKNLSSEWGYYRNMSLRFLCCVHLAEAVI